MFVLRVNQLCDRAAVCIQRLDMVKLELDRVVIRRMKEDDIEMVKALIKVRRPTTHTHR